MIAIGFDPGTARLGYGVIESEPEPRAIDFGVIVTERSVPMAQRLLTIHSAVGELIDRHQPGAVAVELLFFARNVTTAMTVGQARGVVLLAAAGTRRARGGICAVRGEAGRGRLWQSGKAANPGDGEHHPWAGNSSQPG